MAPAILLAGSLAFLAGIFLSSFISSFFFALGLAAAGVFVFTLFWSNKAGIFLAVVLVFLGLAMARFELAESAIPEPLSEPREVRFLGALEEEPEPEAGFTKLVVSPGAAQGKVLVFAPPFAEFRKGDVLLLEGKLASPPVFEDFDWRAFLAKDGIFWTMWQPEITVEQQGHSLLERVRKKFRETLEGNLSSPESFVLSSMLLGDKSRLPDDLKEQLNKTGTRHITAISGMHVAIFTGIISSFFVGAGLPRRYALLATLLFVLFFIALTGFQTSAVRAGIMGGTLLVGGVLGRQSHSLRLLVIVAALMLAFHPFLLSLDVGFQLSFLAVLGIILFAPPVKEGLKKMPEAFGFKDALAMTLAAQLFTFPVLLSTFGAFSLVSALTNVLIVPLLPLVLVLGALFLLLSAWIPFLGFPASLPIALLLSFMVAVIEYGSQIPHAVLLAQGWFWWILFLFVPLSVFAWRRQRQKAFPFREDSMI